MNIGDLFNAIFLIPIINLLLFFYQILAAIHIPGALGFAIIVLTIVIRMVMWPLTHTQLSSTQKMAGLKPKLDELKLRHKDDKMALQKAQMELYKQEGINPMAGCLPTLIQFPILIALYQAIINVFPEKNVEQGLAWINSIVYVDFLKLTQVPDSLFFGLNLATKPSSFMSIGFFLLLVPVITAILTFVQSKMMVPAKPLKIYPSDSPKEKSEKADVDDMMVMMQGQMLYLMPAMVGFFAFQFPVGLALYWNTLTIIGIIQQYKISGWGGMIDIFRKFGININAKSPNRDLIKAETKVTVSRPSKKKHAR